MTSPIEPEELLSQRRRIDFTHHNHDNEVKQSIVNEDFEDQQLLDSLEKRFKLIELSN